MLSPGQPISRGSGLSFRIGFRFNVMPKAITSRISFPAHHHPSVIPHHRQPHRFIPSKVLLAMLAIPPMSWSHGADAAAAIHPAHIGSGVDMLEPDDSLKIAVDMFGYLANSWTSTLGVGTPLGAGGKGPRYYNQWLYKNGPFDRPHLEKPDLRPGYEDFSYVPIWQPDQLELRTQYRFLPRIWGSLSLGYDADPITTESEDALHAPTVEELLLKWAPEQIPGWAFTFGQQTLAGSYCPIFDHFTLLHSGFAGLSASYQRTNSGGGKMEWTASVGREMVGRLKKTLEAKTQDIGDPGTALYTDGIRARNHFLAFARYTLAGGFYLGALGEYQNLPEDSTAIVPLAATEFKYHWRRSQGWQAGGEAGFAGSLWEHHFTMSHGDGDVNMAWSGPDAVFLPGRVSPDVEWTRTGSALSQAVYWGGFHPGGWRVDAGAWMQWRSPAKDTGYPYAAGADTALQLRSQDFRAVKFALETSWRLGGMLNLGLRYDGFLYLDPSAHANTTEPLTDAALRPIPIILPDGTQGQLTGPSPWEREAVNSHIVSVFAQLDPGGDFHARAGWSGAKYGKEVTRQGSIGDFHANATLAAWFTYRFGQGSLN